MKVFVVLEDPGYGLYVHLVKAGSTEEAKNVISKKLDECSSIKHVTALDDFLSSLSGNDSICIGGYEE
jgi:hypothetical protein